LVRCAARRVTNRENEGDDNDRQKSEEYPAAVADEVVLNPRNHDEGSKKMRRLDTAYDLSIPCLHVSLRIRDRLDLCD
jgi:hypothetical protein